MIFKNRFIKKLTAATAALLVALTPVGGVFAADKNAPADGEEASDIVKEIANYLGAYSRYDEVSANGLMRKGHFCLQEKNPQLYDNIMKAKLNSKIKKK